MAYGDRSGGFGGGRGGGGGGFGGGRSFGGPREMHKATCSDCGKECEVPFKPSSGPDGNPRPVYCRDCYQNHKKF
ncbi:MAG TPA: CxxC-x17-CxxC domain-containing protein [Candidatus Nanoarchaeia archaeon]|nr:CxxC-x17-CxxC domain-containing protein [Candidatus Nanoarchaeia archaeon]